MSRYPVETIKTIRARSGHKTVGTTAVQLTTIEQELKKGVLLRAPGADDLTPNTVPVWIGLNASVTADHDVNTGGMPLPPGASIVMPVENLNDIWLISSAVSQDVAWVGV